MASIYLIRHGQASFGQQNYDQLSELGTAQSTRLGKYWQQMPAPRKIFSGNLVRHHQTAQGFLAGLGSCVAPVIKHSDFNEFDHRDILAQFNPAWKDSDYQMSQNSEKAAAIRAFRREFYPAIARWIEGRHDASYRETFSEFQQRCVGGITDVITQTAGERATGEAREVHPDIMIFTSGGPISVICAHILELTSQKAFELNRQLLNTGITKLNYSEKLLSLDYLNGTSHLDHAGDQWLTGL